MTQLLEKNKPPVEKKLKLYWLGLSMIFHLILIIYLIKANKRNIKTWNLIAKLGRK